MTSDDIIRLLKKSGPENETPEDFKDRALATLNDGESLTALELQNVDEALISETVRRIEDNES